MATHQEIQEWYEHWFGARRDANSQNALAALHGILGTKPKLEDKLTSGSMKKSVMDDLNKGIINIEENT